MRDRHVTDQSIEHLLTGRLEPSRPELASVAAFFADLRSAALAEPEPAPSPGLAAVLEGATTGRPTLRDRAQGAARSFRIRVAAAAAILVTGTLGVAGAGALPGPAQDAADKAFEVVGLERDNQPDDPGSQSDENTTSGSRNTGVIQSEGDPPAGAGLDTIDPPTLTPPDDGRQFGEDVADDASEQGVEASDDAREEHQPDAGPQTEENGGTPAEEAPIDEAPPSTPPGSQQGD